VEIGVKHGLLDTAMLHISAFIRFGNQIIKGLGDLSNYEFGKTLIDLSVILKNHGDDKSALIGKFHAYNSENEGSPYVDLIDYICQNYEGRLFKDSTVKYLTIPVFRQTASPLFWHICETAESGGFLPEMTEILGEFILDNNNLITAGSIIGETALLNQRLSYINKNEDHKTALEILDTICQIKDGAKFIARIKGSTVSFETIGVSGIFDDGRELGEFHTISIRILNTIKNILGADSAEKDLPQRIIKTITVSGREHCFDTRIKPLADDGENPVIPGNYTEEWEIGIMRKPYDQ
jgi:hypothetical protein